MTFKSFLNEKLTRKRDYQIEDVRVLKFFNKIISARQYIRIATFNISNHDFYCILVMRGDFIEPHFGTFKNPGDLQKIRELVLEDNISEAYKLGKESIKKDGILRRGINFLGVISYLYSILFDYLDKKPISDVRILAVKDKFQIYKKLILRMIEEDHKPFKLVKEGEMDYESKNDKDERVAIKVNFLELKYSLS